MARNMVVLHLTKDGDIYCQEISEFGLLEAGRGDSELCWSDGGVIQLDELMDILRKER